VLVHPIFRESGKSFVGHLLFRERRIQKSGRPIETELGGPGLEGTVTSDLIMLDRLRGRQQAGIQGGHAFVFFHDLLAFRENSHDGVACFAAGALVNLGEDALKTLHLALAHLKKKQLMDGKSVCLSLETDDPDIAKRHMRVLVPMLVAEGRLSPDSGAAKEYGRKRIGAHSSLKSKSAD
jgi:hypothetical protein